MSVGAEIDLIGWRKTEAFARDELEVGVVGGDFSNELL